MISKKAAKCLLRMRERAHKCRISNVFTFSFMIDVTVQSIGLIYIAVAE